ncbi:PIR protein, putative [Plasmodium sp. gorilla clade G1]|nr:PIR protein, putative [Plasmodium sp. gorilla clade G1]
MKLHYSKILLFSISLSIFVSSSYANHENKPYITAHTPITTSRALSECDTNTSIYDNDPDMKSVKENFYRQTSHRFEEYEERMIKKRQKCKEQCDKDMQKIILKDKIEKSLEKKVFFKCGCGLGGVAAAVGIIGPVAVSVWEKAAIADAVQKGITAGISKAIDGLGNILELNEFQLIDWVSMVTSTTYNKPMELVKIVNFVNNKCTESAAAGEKLFCSATKSISEISSMLDVKTISPMAADVAREAGKAAKTAEAAQIDLVNAASYNAYSAIGYSVLAILIILLVMVIIYLILRYRRIKKMNKKQQYTKLLNQ